jgi:hypothetical protein
MVGLGLGDKVVERCDPQPSIRPQGIFRDVKFMKEPSTRFLSRQSGAKKARAKGLIVFPGHGSRVRADVIYYNLAFFDPAEWDCLLFVWNPKLDLSAAPYNR